MPLAKGKSKAVFDRNVSDMVRAGHPQANALAAAYRVRREAKRSRGGRLRRADGGGADDSDFDVVPTLPGRDIQAAASELRSRPFDPGSTTWVPGAVGKMIAPNITSVLSGEDRPPIPDITRLPPGKVPSSADPRIAGAGPEIAGLVASAVPGVGLAGQGIRAAGVAGRAIAPEIAGLGTRIGAASGAADTQTIAGIMGAGANMAPGAAEASPRLTRDQQRQLEIKQREADIQAKLEQQQAQQRIEAEKRAREYQTQADIARQKAQTQADIEKQAAIAQADRDEKLRQQNQPFSQKFQPLAQMMPFLGGASSLALPMISRIAKMPAQNALAREWRGTVNEAEQALASKDYATASRAIAQLHEYGKQWNKASGVSPGLYAGSAVDPAVATMLPMGYDAMVLPAGDPNKQAALDTLTNPTELAHRVIPALGEGLALASTGTKLGLPGQEVPPIARSAGLVASRDLAQAPPAPPAQPSSLTLTKGEEAHIRGNMDAVKAAVPSAKLRGNTLEFDPEHKEQFLDYVDTARANLPPGAKRLPPSFYKPKALEGKIRAAGDEGRASGGRANEALPVAYRLKREGRQMGGMSPPPAPWYTRQQARGMAGPLRSPVPGRTDKLPITVGGGSYILPADHVSHLGQNNTEAGFHVLNHMFGPGGPYGAGAMPIHRGSGAPRMPGATKIPGLGNLAKGGGVGKGVQIIAAGGEYSLSPEQVAAVGGGDIDHGHRVLDHWVESTRKKHVKTLSKLPGPAKS